MWNSEGTSYKRPHVILRMVERMQSAWAEASKGKPRISVVDLRQNSTKGGGKRKAKYMHEFRTWCRYLAVSARCMFSRNDM